MPGSGSAVNDATRELGGTLGVAVVGSVFSSVFGAHLASGSYAALPGDLLGRAQDSVGVAQAAAVRDPRLVTAFHDSFLAGDERPRASWSGCSAWPARWPPPPCCRAGSRHRSRSRTSRSPRRSPPDGSGA